jgi:hypothetical protein
MYFGFNSSSNISYAYLFLFGAGLHKGEYVTRLGKLGRNCEPGAHRVLSRFRAFMDFSRRYFSWSPCANSLCIHTPELADDV